MWFAGAHSDVGGGYHDEDKKRFTLGEADKPDKGGFIDKIMASCLATIPLSWMVEKATAAGLELEPGSHDRLKAFSASSILAAQHNSNTELWHKIHKLARMKDVIRAINNAQREVDKLPLLNLGPSFVERVHESVRARNGKPVKVWWREEKEDLEEDRTYSLRTP